MQTHPEGVRVSPVCARTNNCPDDYDYDLNAMTDLKKLGYLNLAKWIQAH